MEAKWPAVTLILALCAAASTARAQAPREAVPSGASGATAGETLHTDTKIYKARWLSYGTTGFGLALSGAVIGIGFGTESWETVFTGFAAAHVVFSVGPSLGHFELRHLTQGYVGLFGRLLFGAGGSALFTCGLLEGMLGGELGGGLIAGGVLGWLVSIGLAAFDFATLSNELRTDSRKTAAPKKEDSVDVDPSIWVGRNGAGIGASGMF